MIFASITRDFFTSDIKFDTSTTYDVVSSILQRFFTSIVTCLQTSFISFSYCVCGRGDESAFCLYLHLTTLNGSILPCLSLLAKVQQQISRISCGGWSEEFSTSLWLGFDAARFSYFCLLLSFLAINFLCFSSSFYNWSGFMRLF